METATAQPTAVPLGLEQPASTRGRSHRGRGRGRGRGNAHAVENGEPRLAEEANGQPNKPKRPRKKKSRDGPNAQQQEGASQEPGPSRSQPTGLNPTAATFEFRPGESMTWQQQEMFGNTLQQSRPPREQPRPAPQLQITPDNSSSTRGGRNRGGRGGRGRGDRGGRNAPGLSRAQAVDGKRSDESLSSVGNPPVAASSSNAPLKKPRTHVVTKRSFGGGLTTEDGNGEGDEDQEAAPAAPTNKGKERAPRPPKTKTVKEAEDLMGRLHQSIGNGSYECMVCYSGVTKKSKVWSCERCYAVFHLHCIQKWSKAAMSSGPEQSGANDPPRTWRCPGCQNPSANSPNKYTCWCKKVDNPEVVRLGAPHSCGEICHKAREVPKKCPHPCELQCHAGPCPPCALMGPAQKCFCGRESKKLRCVDTDYENGWSCEQVCAELMPCGIHTCPQPCHAGDCGECMVWEEQKCYCGKHTRKIKCSEKLPCKKSSVEKEDGVETWDGYWKCHETCDKPYDCGVHHCEQLCHPQDLKTAHCPLSPDIKNSCNCGKTKIKELGLPPREACTDPIPSCDKVCNKILPCGHKCPRVCHIDDCGVCLLNQEITCRCGRMKLNSLCHQGYEYEAPQCTRVCKVIMNCGRHECGEKCCAGEQAAMERLKQKKRQRPLGTASNADEGFESQHICTRVCGKTLKCGSHTCNMLCHRGPCGTCLEASFEELTCHCGRTSIPPPVRCGTKPPPCPHQCTRPKDCDHPAVPHNCHGDEEKCPKCPYLTTKRCVCGKKEMKSQPCWRDQVSCAIVCGKRLACGSHLCRKVCHIGPCEDPCGQACGKSKSCGHPCTEPCHAPFVCHEEKPCQTKITLMCDCGGIKQDIKCGATKTAPGNRKELKCGDSCRARRMALALEIDPDGEGSAAKGYSDETCALWRENPKWCSGIEATLREFIDKPSTKQLNFPPMKKSQRGFIHNYSEDCGLQSESQDPEPYRSVAVYKGTKLAMHPRKTIAQFIATKPQQPATNLHATSSSSSLVAQLKKPVKQAFNAFLLTKVQIGITKQELESQLDSVLRSSQLRFTASWIADEDAVLQPKSSSLSSEEIELELEQLKPTVKRVCVARGLATAVDLCWLGRDGKVAYKEGQQWSVVGSKGGSGIPMERKSLATPNAFSALSPSAIAAANAAKAKEELREKKEKEKKALEVVDDWEAVAEEEEKAEEAASAAVASAAESKPQDEPAVEAIADASTEAASESKTEGTIPAEQTEEVVPPTAAPIIVSEPQTSA